MLCLTREVKAQHCFFFFFKRKNAIHLWAVLKIVWIQLLNNLLSFQKEVWKPPANNLLISSFWEERCTKYPVAHHHNSKRFCTCYHLGGNSSFILKQNQYNLHYNTWSDSSVRILFNDLWLGITFMFYCWNVISASIIPPGKKKAAFVSVRIKLF